MEKAGLATGLFLLASFSDFALPALRLRSGRSPLKKVHWTALSAFGGRGSPTKFRALDLSR
jgi:hypothetical protein